MGELNCPSLEYVYNMTYAEFCIRFYAYQRMERKEWFKVREIAYASLIGSHLNPKKLPKSKEAFIPLNPKRKRGQREKIRKRIQEARDKYFRQKELLKK